VISSDEIDLCSSLENVGVEIWIDGGWSVDALLGEQSRSHQDFDIVIEEKDMPKIERNAARKRIQRDKDGRRPGLEFRFR
jgi:hypothetical protein